MGLFDKKYCDICSKEIKLFGGKKVEDGNICKDCASKLSPFFSDRRKSTVNDIKQQLAYRQQNQVNLQSFNPTKIIGDYWKVYVDTNTNKFVVTNSDYRKTNADLIDVSAVCGYKVTLEEDRTEIYDHDSEGKEISYNPPRFEYAYNFKVELKVNHPYFDEINFKLNKSEIEDPQSSEFRECDEMANELSKALTGNEYTVNKTGLLNPALNAYSSTSTTSTTDEGSWYCPNCGNSNTGNFCYKCGTARPTTVNSFCSNCGYKFETTEAVKFCPKCGKQQY